MSCILVLFFFAGLGFLFSGEWVGGLFMMGLAAMIGYFALRSGDVE